MAVLGAYIVPHPPLIIPEVGSGRETLIQKTIDSYDAVAREIADLKPETIVVISPHTALYADYFHISPGPKAHGDMMQFGAPQVSMDVKYDDELIMTISGESMAQGIPAGTQGQQDAALDHATFIPLYFVNKYYTDYKAVRCGFSGMGPAEHLKFGKAIRYAADDLNRNIVLIASGDLSHKLTEDGPYGFAPEGPVFDEYIVNAIKENDLLRFLTAPADICNGAAECGLHSFQVMCGVLDGSKTESKFYSYEGPFGVGYGVGSFTPTSKEPGWDLMAAFTNAFSSQMDEIRKNESPIVSFARKFLEEYVRNGKRLNIDELSEVCSVPDDFCNEAAGTFVSIKKHGQLRGCIGTTQAVQKNIISEVAANAISAGMRDPRFRPVAEEELFDLTYSVDILGKAEAISSLEELDPAVYGVIVTSDGKRGLLLPDLEGIDDPEEQVSIACRKAGISPDEDFEMERFKVERFR